VLLVLFVSRQYKGVFLIRSQSGWNTAGRTQLITVLNTWTTGVSKCRPVKWHLVNCRRLTVVRLSVARWSVAAPNRCIIGDANLPQTGTKLTKNAVPNLALCCGAIWRHRKKTKYRCTTTVHPVYKLLQKDLGKFTSCRTFGAHKVVHSEPFLDYLYKVWHLLSALGSDVRKKIYIGAYLRSGP